MSTKSKADWSNFDGALPKPKRLHLEKYETDRSYHCPIQIREHERFQSQRGCRKHVNNKHRWFFYFDEKLDLKEAKSSLQGPNNLPVKDKNDDVSRVTAKQAVRQLIPSFSVSGQISETFKNWL